MSPGPSQHLRESPPFIMEAVPDRDLLAVVLAGVIILFGATILFGAMIVDFILGVTRLSIGFVGAGWRFLSPLIALFG
jgi:hypothetical protein